MGCSIVGRGWSAVSMGAEYATTTVDMVGGGRIKSVNKGRSGFWEESSFVGEDLEFCLAGDRVDSGSGMVSVSSKVL